MFEDGRDVDKLQVNLLSTYISYFEFCTAADEADSYFVACQKVAIPIVDSDRVFREECLVTFIFV